MEQIFKNDIIDIDIIDSGKDGEGVAKYAGKTIFIQGAIVGERVSCKIILVKKDFCVGILHKIIKTSPYRVVAKCSVYKQCGGCSCQHIDYNYQLKIKQAKVQNALSRVGKINCTVNTVTASDKQFNYRNKLSLPLRATPATAGFFAQNSHRIVPITTCPIQFKTSEKLIKITLDYLNKNNISGYDETTQTGLVRHLVARELGGVTVITLVLNGGNTPQIKALNEVFAAEYANSYAYYVNFNTKNTNVILGDTTQFIGGNNGNILVDGLNLFVHPKSFFQVNDFIRKKIYSLVVNLVSADEKSRILEAYAGAGVLTAKLAQNADFVVGVELDASAVKSATQLAKDNNIDNFRVHEGDCKTEIPKLCKQEKFSAIVLDPPRGGCDISVMEAVKNSGVNKLIYISCNPATLARDLAIVVSDYKIISVQPFDMFPQTAEVETVAYLEKV